MVIKRRHLYLLASLIWGIPGILVTIKGVVAYTKLPDQQLWWCLLVTVSVITLFYFIFDKVAGGYIKRIGTLSKKLSLHHAFPMQGWILLSFMMALGIALRNIPAIPLEFTASFYLGLGPMLILSSARFLRAMLYC